MLKRQGASTFCNKARFSLGFQQLRTVFVAEVHVGTGLAQHLGDLHVPKGGCEVQRTADGRHFFKRAHRTMGR